MRHFRYALIFHAPPRVLDTTQVREIGTFSIPSSIRLARMALLGRGLAYQIEHSTFISQCLNLLRFLFGGSLNYNRSSLRISRFDSDKFNSVHDHTFLLTKIDDHNPILIYVLSAQKAPLSSPPGLLESNCIGKPSSESAYRILSWSYELEIAYPSRQNSCGHRQSSETLVPASSASKRHRIISSISESLTLKTSARISLAASSSIAFRSLCTALFCGLISCS